jgi:hypothetical protein
MTRGGWEQWLYISGMISFLEVGGEADLINYRSHLVWGI